jgi:hypothetical protein
MTIDERANDFVQELKRAMRCEASGVLPPRLQRLMQRRAEADRETVPSLVPSLEDMRQPIDPRHESFDEQSA